MSYKNILLALGLVVMLAACGEDAAVNDSAQEAVEATVEEAGDAVVDTGAEVVEEASDAVDTADEAADTVETAVGDEDSEAAEQ